MLMHSHGPAETDPAAHSSSGPRGGLGLKQGSRGRPQPLSRPLGDWFDLNCPPEPLVAKRGLAVTSRRPTQHEPTVHSWPPQALGALDFTWGSWRQNPGLRAGSQRHLVPTWYSRLTQITCTAQKAELE